MTATRYYLDSSYVTALSVPNDDYHDRATRLARYIEESRIRLVTTTAVSLEVGNYLARQRYRAAAVALLESLGSDRMIDVVSVTPRIYRAAFHLYQERLDKEWGLTDCCSFVVMRERRLTYALTADEHFRQAGFRALLLE